MPVIQLTDRFCAAVKAEQRRQVDWFDSNTTGLHLRVSPGGTKTFALFFRRRDGRRARYTIGRYPELSLASARKRAKIHRAEIVDGKFSGAAAGIRNPRPTVADLVEEYILRHASTKRRGDEIARRLRHDVVVKIGHIHLEK